jgi:hypothetical protein
MNKVNEYMDTPKREFGHLIVGPLFNDQGIARCPMIKAR